jgi:CheY-like chemotaxis protein/anti-sigma regulatory factor (Ser/Thr protein kinase)
MSGVSNHFESQSIKLLIVDDEPMMRRLLQRTLEKHGAIVSLASGAQEARDAFEKHGCAAFDAVISDYLMSGETGLSLITWLQSKDPSLAAIIVTAETDEKNLATQTLRAGGLDFLKKPIDTPMLLAAVDKAVDRTRKQRNLMAADSQVKLVAEIQSDLMCRQSQQYPGRFEVFFRPQHEAGGDFLRVIPEGERIFEVLIGDVSGHDLRAAFISAYFQGMARGMRERGSSSQQVFQFFNSFLIHEWNDQKAESPRITSIAACSLRVDLDKNTLIMLGCGSPTPLVLTTNGHLRLLGNSGGPPLGWFDNYEAVEYHDCIEQVACLYVWTDGVDELAHRTQLNIVTVLFLLLHHRERFFHDAQHLGLIADDILAARIWIQTTSSQEDGYWPFFGITYRRDQRTQIDQFQDAWARSLREVFPGIDPEKLYDILLASREAVLNALEHGCQSPSSIGMAFQMSCQPEKYFVRVRIIDDGLGHDFDWDFHDRQTELIDRHRGLTLIKKLPQSVRTERQGATVIMDFQLDPLKNRTI